MGASSSSSSSIGGGGGGTRPPASISMNEHGATATAAASSSPCTEDAHPANDDDDDGRRRGHFETAATYVGQPRSQVPANSRARTDEFCDQRSTGLGLSPKRETMLTYAAQMTGWQSADGHGPPMCQPNNEVMELSRIISQLAVANHQLASAHSATLARMEALYLELSRQREEGERKARAIAPEGAARTRDDRLGERPCREDGVGGLERRVVRLENLLAIRSRWSGESRRDAAGKVPEDSAGSDVVGTNVSRLLNEDEKRSTSVDLDGRLTDARLADDDDDDGRRSTTKSPTRCEETIGLSEEIARLRADRAERESANERLSGSLADQKNLMEKLSGDYEELKARHATVEANLHAHRQRYDELTKHLDAAKGEVGRLLREIDLFQTEKNAADARISALEQELQRTLLEKEQMKSAESQRTSRLRAQLSEEVSDKKKQIKALEDALLEIRRLKETIKTERRSENDAAAEEDIDAIDVTNDPSETGTSDSHGAATNMEEFKRELALKREARHRAIAAVSSEMERLRRDLDAEREAHSKTSSALARLRAAQNHRGPASTDDDLAESTEATAAREGWKRNSDESEKAARRAEAQRLTNTLKVSDELRNDVRYQIEKVDDLRYHLETDPERHRRRIRCLTEATGNARESLRARECRTNELKDYLAQVLVRLGDRSFLEVRDDAGAECARQLENINALKGLYNERLRVLTELRDSAVKELADARQKLEYTVKRSENLEEELRKAEEKVDAQASEITNLESQLGLTKADCRDLQNQMSLINGLFTQMLLGATSADMDLDRLTQLLQENHDLISDIAREESTEAAALPKLLLDLVEQVEGGGKASQRQADAENGDVEGNGEIDRKEDDLQEEDIAHNLPKVWRVLLELLSCHAVTSPSVSVASCSDPNSCYKSVDTPAGPRLVISVSKTYIRLKELILEKKHLEKEMNRMKQLNAHLDSKLGEQEKRLSMVSVELTKTWDIVGRMQAQHQQLHTHEEILRYELQEKRKMLQELKQELEYCREKWESARQKNTNTELEWRNLRREFAARKALAAAHDSFCSAESGFSDEKGDDTDEEEGTIEGRIRHGPRRRTRKEGPRAPTPDTESEQPTDTELSESKTGSSAILEQRTPTPETELDEVEVAEAEDVIDSAEPIDNIAEHVAEITQEIMMDPLDRALANVIQNLIRIDDGAPGKDTVSQGEDAATSSEDSRDDPVLGETNGGVASGRATSKKTEDIRGENSRSWANSPIAVGPWCPGSPTANTLKRTVTSNDLPSAVEGNGEPIVSSSTTADDSTSLRRRDDKETMVKSESISPPVCATTTGANTSSATSVFSIGPHPASCPSPPSITKSTRHDDLSIADTTAADRGGFFAPVFGAATAESDNSADKFVACTSPSSARSRSSQGERSAKGEKQRSSKPTESVADSDSVSVDSSSSLDTVREFPTADPGPAPPASPSKEEPREGAIGETRREVATATKPRTPEEVLAARADRLKRLEEQADWLVKRMNATSRRGTALCTRLEELHDAHGEPPSPPAPPPMPDVLPSRRLPSCLPDLPRQVSARSSSPSVIGDTVDTRGESRSDAAGDDTPRRADTSR